MKKKFLLMAILMIVGAFNSSMFAQKDVTSLYIKNATLSTLQDWDVLSFNTPVRGNNTTGYATEVWAGNPLSKTEYSLTQKIKLPKGNYTLVNYSFYRQSWGATDEPSKSLAKLKAGEKEIDIKTLGSIEAAGYANSQAEGANCFDSKMYRNTLDFTIDKNDTEIEIGVVGTHDATASWVIVGMFELIDNDQPATMDSPFDVTGYITNPGFEYRDMTGWEQSGQLGLGAHGVNTSDPGHKFATGGYFAERWQGSGNLPEGSMSQTLTSLPAGYYQLTANLGGKGTYVDLNGKTANWTADKDYTVGYVLGEDENLTITAGTTGEGIANWVHFDNFRLYYCGDVVAALTTLCDKVSEYEDKLPTVVYNQLVSDVALYKKTYEDVDELIAAIAAVNALYQDADVVAAAYTAAETNFKGSKYYDMISDLAAADYKELEEGAHDALMQALNSVTKPVLDKATLNTFTTAEQINSYIDGLNSDGVSVDEILVPAGTTYYQKAEPIKNGVFPLTFLLTNANLEGLPTWKPCDGWASEETDGNSQVMTNDSKTNGDKTAFYEYWSDPAKASGKFALYLEVNLLPGTYNMSCYAFAEDQYTSNTKDGVFFYANNTQGSGITSTKLEEANIEFVNDEEGKVKIGLKTIEGNTRNWMGIGYVELYRLAPKACELTDADTGAPAAGAYNTVTYNNRSLLKGLNTLVLPFQTTKAELGAEAVLEYTGTTINSDNKTVLNFKEVETLSPNVPYAIMMTADAALPVFEGKTLIAPTDLTVTDANGNYDFVGTYTWWKKNDNSPIVNGDYVAGADEFKKASGGNGLKAYRAYLKKVSEADPVNITFNFNGEIVNGIEAVEIFNRMSGDIYNLNGQKVSRTQKGVYIINGKKVIVK